jgi:rubredoxin
MSHITKYMCRGCGYVYDPASGDESKGVAGGVSLGMSVDGVPFEALPSNWLCPLCGVDKTEFVVW